ncbi:hypothetical protein HPB47_023060 [Ixodes persulcatus]|uniref:Uncharacterized protein n=1 Tax=Ixodes persulcatus TaxID=34615 RepID=A0AC60Q962_IXOPE|nr:hypothetical protein HPB47_023060 [Ixodes persulcatus]
MSYHVPIQNAPRAGKIRKGPYLPDAGYRRPKTEEASEKSPTNVLSPSRSPGRVSFPKAGKQEAKPPHLSAVVRVRAGERKSVPPRETRRPSAPRTGRSSRQRRPSVPTLLNIAMMPLLMSCNVAVVDDDVDVVKLPGRRRDVELRHVDNDVDDLTPSVFIAAVQESRRCARPAERPPAFERAPRLERAAPLFVEFSHVRIWINMPCRKAGAPGSLYRNSRCGRVAATPSSCRRREQLVPVQRPPAIVLPTAASDGMSWDSSLLAIPSSLTNENVNEYYAARKTTDRNRRRNYKFLTESYLEPSSLETPTFLRDQKKTGKPYCTTATFAADGAVEGQGYEEAPPEVSCTELPQQWRRPRGSRIAATSVDGVDWRSVREGGSSKPVGSRLYDARKRPRDPGEMEEAMRGLGSGLGDSPFAKHLRCVQVLGTNSTFGVVPEGSPLAYQQPLAPHGFQTYVGPNIALCARGVSTAQQPTWPGLFDAVGTFKLATGILASAESNLHEELFMPPDEARELEKNSRQQSKSLLWKAARKNRLTASAFGVAKSRES